MRRIFLAIALIVALVPAACSRRPSRVVLGIGLTSNAHPGVKLAAKEINDAGGIGGVLLELLGMDWLEMDNAYDPASTLNWAERFAAQPDLLAVIGHNDSATTLTAAAIYNRNKIPQIVTIATNPSITNIGAWTYRLCLSDSDQGPALAEYAVKDWNKRRIAIFYVNDDYGRALAQLFEKHARELGAKIIASIMHRNALQPDDQDQIRSALAEMKKDGAPDLIALFQRVDAAIWTVKAIHDAGMQVDILGCDNLAQASFSNYDSKSTEGIRVSQFLNLESGDARAMRFARDFRAFAGSEPDYAQAFAYDAIYLMRDAILNGRFSRAGVKAYLDRLIREKIPIHGVSGSFTLGPDHDARRLFYVAEIHDGHLRVLKALPVNAQSNSP